MTSKAQADNDKILAAMVGQKAAQASRRMTAKERALSGRKDPETVALIAQADAIIAQAQADGIIEQEETPVQETQTKTEKTPRVLPDPVENARLIRMRAKWTAERRERDVARCEEEMETASTPAERREVSGRMKTAKSVLVEAQVAERKAYKVYTDLLEARKAAKKAAAAPAKTASEAAKTAVADPDDLDATINAQRESR